MVNMNVDFWARILLRRAYLSVSYPWPCPGGPVAIIPSVALPLPPVLQEVLWAVSSSSVHHALTLSPRRPACCTQCPCLSGGDWFPLLSCQLSPSGAARQIVMLGKVGICPKLPSRCAGGRQQALLSLWVWLQCLCGFQKMAITEDNYSSYISHNSYGRSLPPFIFII